MATRIRWDREEWGPYFRHIADRLGLKDWALRIGDSGPANPNHNASIRGTRGQRDACIYLSDNFLREPEDNQRQTAVHEVLHCHGAHERHLLEGFLNGDQWAAWELAQETGHDAIATAIAPMFPLPSEVLGGAPAKSRRK